MIKRITIPPFWHKIAIPIIWLWTTYWWLKDHLPESVDIFPDGVLIFDDLEEWVFGKLPPRKAFVPSEFVKIYQQNPLLKEWAEKEYKRISQEPVKIVSYPLVNPND